jgi:hypothetical protein
VTSDLLTRVLVPDPPPFALLHRPEWTGRDRVGVLSGELCLPDTLADTYRYPTDGPSVAGLMAFLDSHKESDELHMVLDEELKMMARTSSPDGPQWILEPSSWRRCSRPR